MKETTTEAELDLLLSDVDEAYIEEFDKLVATIFNREELIVELTYNRQELAESLEQAINSFKIPDGTLLQITTARLILQSKGLKYLLEYSNRVTRLKTSWED